eukprot:TCONS_00018061-protein
MVNKDTFEKTTKPQRKSSVPIVIPKNNGRKYNGFNSLQPDYEKSFTRKITPTRKISNPVDVPMIFDRKRSEINYDNDTNENSYDDEFISFDASHIQDNQTKNTELTKNYTRNLIQRNRKTSVMFNSTRSTTHYSENVKKKKSSSGVSSSSSDNNFPLHTHFTGHSETPFEDDRKFSDISIDELMSSTDSSPAVSRRSSSKKLSDISREDLGYSSMKEKARVPKTSSTFNSNLNNKLGRQSTSKKIGLWTDKINSQQKANNETSTIYSLRDKKKRTSKKESNAQDKINENNKSNESDGLDKIKPARRRNTTITSDETERIEKIEPRPKVHRSISAKVSSFFGKKRSRDVTNNSTGEEAIKKKISASVQPVEETVTEEKPKSQPPSRKTSQHLQLSSQQVTQLRRQSETNNRYKEEERKLSFVELHRKFSANTPAPQRRRTSAANTQLVDQSTQTVDMATQTINNKLHYLQIVNNQHFNNTKSLSPSPPKERRRSLPMRMFGSTNYDFGEKFSPLEPNSTIPESELIDQRKSRSVICRCGNYTLECNDNKKHDIGLNTIDDVNDDWGIAEENEDIDDEDDLDFGTSGPDSDFNTEISDTGLPSWQRQAKLSYQKEEFGGVSSSEGNTDLSESEEPSSLPSWQKNALANDVRKTSKPRRKFSYNPQPTQPIKKPLRRNKSHEINSINHPLSNAPWYQDETPVVPNIRTTALSTSLSQDETETTSQSCSASEAVDDQPKVSVIHRPDLSQIALQRERSYYDDHNDGLDDFDKPTEKNYVNLKDLKNAPNIDLTSNLEAISLDPLDPLEDQIRSRANTFDNNMPNEFRNMVPELPATLPRQRRRKTGIVHLHALDSLPQRRRSVYQRDTSEISNSFDGVAEPSSSLSRKISTAFGGGFPHFMQDDANDSGPTRKMSTAFAAMPYPHLPEEVELVSDQNTLNVIVDSYDALNMDVDIAGGTSGMASVQPFDNNNIHLLYRQQLDNLEEEEQDQEIMTPTAGTTPPFSEDSYQNMSGFLEKRRRELLVKSDATREHASSPQTNRKFFGDQTDSVQSTPKVSVDETDSNTSQNGGGCSYTAYSTMFGYFNHFLYIFITKEYGNDKWTEITRSLKLTKEQKNMFKNAKHIMFDDEITDKVLNAAAKHLLVNFKLLLSKYGMKYYEYCSEKYGGILKSIATNLTDFINNMDDIRKHIHKIEKIPDEFPPSIHATNDKKTLSMYIQSSLGNKSLEYFMIGFIKRAALDLFGIRSRVSLKQERSDPKDYSIVEIKAITSLIKKPSLSKLQMSGKCKDLILEPDVMDRVFPFHFILNDKFEITQLGDSLNRLLEQFIRNYGNHVQTYFQLDEPAIDFTYSMVRKNLNTSFVVSLRREFVDSEVAENEIAGLVLKGQFSFLESSKSLWFIGSPKVDYLKHFNGQSNLFLSDIPLHDVTREVLLVGEQKHSVETLKNQLQIMTNRLKETSKELALGRINTESILDEMFPKDVADKLMRNQPVPTVTTESVTILFTDIVGFTSICEQCDPEEVTVMLNKLYINFDLLCEKYQNYKVETIGDAYMAVGGLHQSESEHGRYVTAMGVEMVQNAKKVKIPRKNENIQIRVGIHSGSVVAGVVGTLMPRYCLFGKNVTLANKMESSSEAGKVHISPYTYLKIKHQQEFIFWQRDRSCMPNLIDQSDPNIKYVNSFFVEQRRQSVIAPSKNITSKKSKTKQPYMQSQHFDAQSSRSRRTATSHRLSRTETAASMSDILSPNIPENLREQIEALDKINGDGKGLVFLNSS